MKTATESGGPPKVHEWLTMSLVVPSIALLGISLLGIRDWAMPAIGLMLCSIFPTIDQAPGFPKWWRVAHSFMLWLGGCLFLAHVRPWQDPGARLAHHVFWWLLVSLYLVVPALAFVIKPLLKR